MSKTNIVNIKTVCDLCGRSEDRIFHNDKVYYMKHIDNYKGLTGDFHFPLCADRKIEGDKEAEYNRQKLGQVIGHCSYSECNKELLGKDSFVYIDGVLYCSPLCKTNSDYFRINGSKYEDSLKAQAEARETDKKREELLNSLSVEQLQKLLEITK